MKPTLTMKPTYTPGPWVVVEDQTAPKGVAVAQDGQTHQDPELIADIWTDSGGIGTEEGEANAQLIAAAPDLLECLTHLTARDWFKEGVTGEVTCTLDAGKVRSAVRKALGQEPSGKPQKLP